MRRAQLGMALLTSRDFIGNFVERRQILPELMAAKSWNISSRELVLDAIYTIPSRDLTGWGGGSTITTRAFFA